MSAKASSSASARAAEAGRRLAGDWGKTPAGTWEGRKGETHATQSIAGTTPNRVGYGNFDIIFDRVSRISQRHPTHPALCAILYLVPC